MLEPCTIVHILQYITVCTLVQSVQMPSINGYCQVADCIATFSQSSRLYSNLERAWTASKFCRNKWESNRHCAGLKKLDPLSKPQLRCQTFFLNLRNFSLICEKILLGHGNSVIHCTTSVVRGGN